MQKKCKNIFFSTKSMAELGKGSKIKKYFEMVRGQNSKVVRLVIFSAPPAP